MRASHNQTAVGHRPLTSCLSPAIQQFFVDTSWSRTIIMKRIAAVTVLEQVNRQTLTLMPAGAKSVAMIAFNCEIPISRIGFGIRPPTELRIALRRDLCESAYSQERNPCIMAKCRKVLPTGRFTKNAVPGRMLCAAHVRIADKAASKPKKK